jgi:hypothetical protein
MGAGACGIESITEKVYRKLIRSMARRIEAVIMAKRAQTKYKHKNCPMEVPCCKIHSKSMSRSKLLYLNTTKQRISSFVTQISHNLSFVP